MSLEEFAATLTEAEDFEFLNYELLNENVIASRWTFDVEDNDVVLLLFFNLETEELFGIQTAPLRQ